MRVSPYRDLLTGYSRRDVARTKSIHAIARKADGEDEEKEEEDG